MTRVLDLELSSLIFEGDDPALIRERIGTAENRDPNYDARYDFRTFIYDCYFDADLGQIVLICPKLLNFSKLLQDVVCLVDGQKVEISRVMEISRGSLVLLKASAESPAELQIRHPLFSGTLKVNAQHNDAFAGKNVVYAISKDNHLDWIQDWLRYYVKEHGANALVLYDNHSTAYSMEDLKTAVSEVDGISVFGLVRAWFPFGPGGSKNTNFNSKFLHMTMVELGRRRLLGDARAVLNVDIDELVYSKSGQSIFDATAASELGYTRVNGEWAYADLPADGQLVRHNDHYAIRSDRRPKVSRKWCVAPTGPLKGRAWLTHRIISRKDPCDPDFGFWHFRRISNNWDYDREEFNADLLEVDTRLVETMARVFGENSTVDDTVNAMAPVPLAPIVQQREAAAEEDRSIIISAMKNEGPYILEWIAYHRAIGFDTFLIYTNDCSDGTDLILDRMQELGILHHERNKVLRRGPQKSALKYAKVHPAVAQSDWIMVSDVDEFLNIRHGDGTLDALLKANADADVISATWKLFSANGRTRFRDKLVMAEYTEAQLDLDEGGDERRFVKSIYRQNPRITRFGTHGPIFEDDNTDGIKWVTPEGEAVEADSPTRPRLNFGYGGAQVNHYAVRSVDSYLVKSDRGRVNHFRQTMGLDYWKKMNKPGKADWSIQRWIEPTMMGIRQMMQDKQLAELVPASIDWHHSKIAELKQVPEFSGLRASIIEAMLEDEEADRLHSAE